MGHFISMAHSKDERQRRYAELVDTAISEFNAGSLGKAVTLLDLAASMVEKKEVDSLYAESVQRRAHGKLDEKHLQSLAEVKEQRQLLRRVLGFFTQLPQVGHELFPVLRWKVGPARLPFAIRSHRPHTVPVGTRRFVRECHRDERPDHREIDDDQQNQSSDEKLDFHAMSFVRFAANRFPSYRLIPSVTGLIRHPHRSP